MTETNDPKPTTFVGDRDVDLTYQQLQTTHKETIVQCHFMKKRDEAL